MFEGDAYNAEGLRRVSQHAAPRPTRELDRSPMARAAFGDRIVEHYVHTAQLEQQAYDRAVTCWELARNFERI